MISKNKLEMRFDLRFKLDKFKPVNYNENSTALKMSVFT